MALKRNAARFVLLGTAARLAVLPAEWATRPDVEILETATDADAAQAATAMARNGEADVVMKGLIGTDTLLKAVLNKETGILPAGNVLTHLAVAQLPGYHKLIFFSDVAVIPIRHWLSVRQFCATIWPHAGALESSIPTSL